MCVESEETERRREGGRERAGHVGLSKIAPDNHNLQCENLNHFLTGFLCPDLKAREHSGGVIWSRLLLTTVTQDSPSSSLSGRTLQ